MAGSDLASDAGSVSAEPLQSCERSPHPLAETQREKKSRAGSRGCYSVLFVAATLCCRVVAAWRRSSPLFLSLPRFLSPTHEQSLTLLLSHLLPASYTVLVHLSLPPPPSCFPFPSHWLITIRILIP